MSLHRKLLHDCPKPEVPEEYAEYRFTCEDCGAIWAYMDGLYGDIVETGHWWNRKRIWVPKPKGVWFCLERPDHWQQV